MQGLRRYQYLLHINDKSIVERACVVALERHERKPLQDLLQELQDRDLVAAQGGRRTQASIATRGIEC